MRTLVSPIALALSLALACATAGCSTDSSEDVDADQGAYSGEALGEYKGIAKALIDEIKPDLGGQDVIADASEGKAFRVKGDWAWVQWRVVLRVARTPPVTTGTIYEDAARAGDFAGFNVEALLKRDGRGYVMHGHELITKWKVVVHRVGARGEWWRGLESSYPTAPRRVFPWLDGEVECVDRTLGRGKPGDCAPGNRFICNDDGQWVSVGGYGTMDEELCR